MQTEIERRLSLVTDFRDMVVDPEATARIWSGPYVGQHPPVAMPGPSSTPPLDDWEF